LPTVSLDNVPLLPEPPEVPDVPEPPDEPDVPPEPLDVTGGGLDDSGGVTYELDDSGGGSMLDDNSGPLPLPPLSDEDVPEPLAEPLPDPENPLDEV
jgi:hypothetical protein